MTDEAEHVPRHALRSSSDDEPEPGPLAASVRPYVITRGRTRSQITLRLETLLSARPYVATLAGTQSAEHQAVVELCSRPRALAEVAALLHVPIGVARVLVGDLVELRALVVHDGSQSGEPPSVTLLLRVLAGLRQL